MLSMKEALGQMEPLRANPLFGSYVTRIYNAVVAWRNVLLSVVDFVPDDVAAKLRAVAG